MTFKDLIVLLPCQSLESLSLERNADEAQQILSAWTSLYHPAVLAQAPGMPRWVSAESPPEDATSSLIVIPECAESSLPEGWLGTAEKAGARVIRRQTDRRELIAAALEGIPGSDSWPSTPLADEFLALGFCHLIIELLTRQLRYMSNLDSERFYRHTADALQQTIEGDLSAAREHLRSAFDRLTEAREYFYPVQTYLLDLTLVAETTLGDRLRRELAREGPVNLLLSGAVVEHLAREDQGLLALLREALDRGSATLVGGEYEERELPLLTPEAVVEQFERGLNAYERCLGHRPKVFGRRRFGLTPILPQVLKNFGFDGALHFTLDDGRFPTGNQSKIRWEGIDGTEVDALARVPWEVDRPDNFLRLPTRLGNTLDTDQGSTIVFAHWAGQTSPWYEDLRRMGQYCPALGKFVSLTSYFESTHYSGQTVRYAADKYRSPYLSQEIEAETADPISRWVQYHRQSVLASDAQAMRTMNDLVRGEASGEPRGQNPNPDAARELACTLAGSQSGGTAGRLYLNPRSHRVRWPAEFPASEAMPSVVPPILAAAESKGSKQVLLETPPMGFAWVGSGTPAASTDNPPTPAKPEQEPLVAEENGLRNEFFQARISPTTGAIQSIQNYSIRGNRLAQQISMRLPPPPETRRNLDPEAEENYSLMAVDEISAGMLGPMVGRVISRGRLVDRAGKRVARFAQTMIARRGSPVLELEIELDIKRMPEPHAWKSYYAVRFAWTDETADLMQGVGLCPQPCEGKYLESPHFLEIRSPKTKLTVFPGGLPYHRRFGFRKLDSLLVVHGETARKFRLGIGVDVNYPAASAIHCIVHPSELYSLDSASGSAWGWLFHLDARNVMATHWEPLCAEGRPNGFRVRLLETEGRYSEATLRAFRGLASARKVDFRGGLHSDLTVDGDHFTVDLAPRQWIQVEATFAGE